PADGRSAARCASVSRKSGAAAHARGRPRAIRRRAEYVPGERAHRPAAGDRSRRLHRQWPISGRRFVPRTPVDRRAAALTPLRLRAGDASPAAAVVEPVALLPIDRARGTAGRRLPTPLRQICNSDCSRGVRAGGLAALLSCRCTLRRSPARGTVIAIDGDAQREVPMYWVFVAVFTGIAFAWVTLRRRRKGAQKTA